MKTRTLAVCIQLLFTLSAGCPPPPTPSDMMVRAAYGGDIATVRAYLDSGMDASTQVGITHESALSAAAKNGHVAIVKLMLDRGADIDHAIAVCEESYRWGMENSNSTVKQNATTCLSLLKRYRAERDEARRQQQETARLQAIEAERSRQMKDMVKEMVAAASAGQTGPAKSAAVRTDIDRPMFAEQAKLMGDNDIAIIIGIEGYQNLPKSDYSYDDAKLVKEYARALGYRERNIELLLDERATKSSIEKTVEAWLRNKAKPDSRVFFYYSGHGAPDPQTGDAYLVPYDGDPNYLSTTGYSLKRLYGNLGRLGVKEVVVVLDSCFSGSGGRSVLAKGARPIVLMVDESVPAPNMAVLSATQGAQISTSSAEKGHGIFTYYFLKALKDGKKTLAEIYEYLKPLVEDEAKQINVQQSPGMRPSVEKARGRFSLRN